MLKLKAVSYYLFRAKQLGLKESFLRARIRINKKFYTHKFKYLARRNKAQHAWENIKKNHGIPYEFEQFLNKIKEHSFVDHIKKDSFFRSTLPIQFNEKEQIIQQADSFTHNCFSSLGSKEMCFSSDLLPWHCDIKNHQSCNSKKFYEDFSFIQLPNAKYDEYFFDRKIPWDISCFHYIHSLGIAYEKTNDEKYAKCFEKHVSDWIDKNPLFLGVNWMCPMFVGIRAVNFIWGFHLFKDASVIHPSFWEKLVCSLYDHAYYLESNWEDYTPTSNHYLSDLIGYFYLCLFFKDSPYFQKKKDWCYKELLKEHDTQIHYDGSSYEGSTHYHKLDTEIFLHFYLLCKTNNISLPKQFIEKFKKMFAFLNDCTDLDKTLVQIGDNDSGKISMGIRSNANPFPTPQDHSEPETSVKKYDNFGLYIIKENNWNITFRNPIFSNRQPSGHFHNDALSITLSIGTQPVLVDPGSYLYTANPTWRNTMRSEENHNRCYITTEGKTFSSLHNDSLFQLSLVEHTKHAKIKKSKTNISIEGINNEYFEYFGLRQHRKIIFDHIKQTLITQDQFFQINSHQSTKNLELNWSLVFHPSIQFQKKDTDIWLILSNGKKLLELQTKIRFNKQGGFFSPSYGTLIKCSKLVAAHPLKLTPFSFTFKSLL